MHQQGKMKEAKMVTIQIENSTNQETVNAATQALMDAKVFFEVVGYVDETGVKFDVSADDFGPAVRALNAAGITTDSDQEIADYDEENAEQSKKPAASLRTPSERGGLPCRKADS